MTLELQGVSKTVEGQTHIYPTDLTLEKGTMNVLLGPTSSGKTSLMRLMAGLDQPATGKIIWQGADVTGQRVQDRKVAMVYQQFINYPSMTVYENVASPMKLMGVDRAEIDRRVRETAELMQLTPMLDRKPLELSGGQQQRCALARALVKNAGLVLLDEPLANLDYKLREELRVEIPKIFEKSGSIFVYATTEPEEALLLGGNTAALWEGRVTQFGPTPEVYRRPVDATTARVFSDPPMNFLPLTKSGPELILGKGQTAPATGTLADLPDGRYTAGFRPNHLEIGQKSEGAIRFTARLVVTELTGSETFVHLDHQGERWVGLIHGIHHLELGKDLDVWLDPRHVYIFSEAGDLVAPASYALAA
ncbi:ABC transporter ATP-binding protein [Roseivivax sp. CAU 1753]